MNTALLLCSPRKRDLQRKREYQQEIKEIQERVKERPLLLEQVAQVRGDETSWREEEESFQTENQGEKPVTFPYAAAFAKLCIYNTHHLQYMYNIYYIAR